MRLRPLACLIATATGCACPACQGAEVAKPQVLTILAKSDLGAETLSITGDIEAQLQANLSFRISGKITSRTAEIGQHVVKNEPLASLDTQQQEADVRVAAANFAAAEAASAPAKIEFQRQAVLIKTGDTTGVKYDTAMEALRRTAASVISMAATLASAKEQLSYTKLVAPSDGVIIARSAEVGQVVQPGQAVVTLAADGARDAVFKVSEVTTAHPPISPQVDVILTSNHAVQTIGTVREISPTIDPTSNTVLVKVGLRRAPAGMSLGSAVIGTATFSRGQLLHLPWSALFRWDDRPAVWVIGNDKRARPRTIEVSDYETETFEVSGGVAVGDVVVIAGGQFLRPGVAVDVVGSARSE